MTVTPPDQGTGLSDRQASTDDARRFGYMAVRVELAALVSNPLSRPTGRALIVGTVASALLVASVLKQAVGAAAALAVGIAVGAVAMVVVFVCVSPRLEARSFAAARYRWLIGTDDGAAGAYAKRDRRGRLTLYGVWAQPQDHGLGAQLMAAVVRDTVDEGEDLWLVAVNERAARFYRRCGFNAVGRELLGTRMVSTGSPGPPQLLRGVCGAPQSSARRDTDDPGAA